MNCEECPKFNKTWKICKIIGDRPDLPCPLESSEVKEESEEVLTG